jgi:hypothetical protein
VPLSEHEQRLLEQMERALYAEDPKFASSLRGKSARSSLRRRVLLAGVGFVLGLVMLMTGLVASIIWVSVVGFLLMLGGAFFAVNSYRVAATAAQFGVVEGGGTVRPARPAGRRPSGGHGHGGLMQRFEDRWNRRREEGP